MHAQEAATCAGVSLRTWRTWEQRNQAPAVVIAWLRLMGGELGTLHGDWQGWRIQGGKIFSPDDPRGFTPGHVSALPYCMTWWAS